VGLLKEKYESLTPQAQYLSDEVVLAQAWKKSHTYIRRHNWYADMLELDGSTIDLEQQLSIWSADVQREDFAPEKLRLVPAPKNAKWEFPKKPQAESIDDLLNLDLESLGPEPSFADWRAKRDKDGTTQQKLRPLAHLAIRDQTLATAVMMCLAEAVETAQGDTTEKDVFKARERGVVSYGNRLQCRWDATAKPRSRAHFSWGNSRTYRQYFQDYRIFLARPRRVCAEFSARVQTGNELYVVSLDIQSFFDKMDCSALLRELQRIEGEYRKDFGLPDSLAADASFWQRTERIFDWAWLEKEHASARLVKGDDAEKLDLGLPQGLVAAGFLANAYLIGLDHRMSELVRAQHQQDGFKVLDYCRYVDDVRIVVEAGSGSLDRLLEDTKAFFVEQLRAHCEALGATMVLMLSDKKCTVTPYRSISAQSNLSALMEVLQAEVSGTFDLDSLIQAAGGLDGLLWMAEQIEDDPEPSHSRLRLANIATPNTDVRDDTVKRFVATRLAQLLRHRLAMTDTAAPIDTGDTLSERVTNGAALAHEFESTARKLIKCWADNPSLVLLLRCGMDLFPHPKLLAPVVEALTTKLFCSVLESAWEKRREVRVAEYVVADLFRAGAVETGFRSPEEYPESIDITGYREDLAALARRILRERHDSPWYLQQQALLFLASIQDHSIPAPSMPELRAHDALHQAMLFMPVNSEKLEWVLPFALVGQQLHPNPRRFGVWLAEGLRATGDEGLQARIVSTVALNRPDLMREALPARSGRSPGWKRFVPAALSAAGRRPTAKKASRTKSNEASLLGLVSSPLNVFSQENALLLLARSLLVVEGIQAHLSAGLNVSEIRLECQDWEDIQALPASKDFLSLKINQAVDFVHPLYVNPPWVSDDKAWLYGLGRVLRSALTGELDYTSRRFLVTEEVGGYTGLRSSWFKRRFGLLNSGQGVLDEPGPVSPWLSGFLSALLQWPGVEFPYSESAKATDARTPEELREFLESRISVQRALYGARCKTPMYVVPTDKHDAELKNRAMRVAVVQPLRPRFNDFNTKDPTYWTAGMLAEHKRHLAEVCRLAYQQLKTWASAQPPASTDDDDDQPIVDVVLFPELSVHPEHLFHLRTLSDKLRANIFAGLTYLHSPKLGAPINQGIWLIRTETPGSGRTIQYAWQGKQHPSKEERDMGVKGYRPHITLVEFPIGATTPTRVAAAICYDATDLDLLADLRDRSDMFLVAAFNRDVETFDNMVAALRFHMYQPVVLANLGEFGGSTAQAPLPKHEKVIAHIHGNNQVAVSVFEIDPSPFKTDRPAKAAREVKGAPAGYKGRPKRGV
jgi:hypothetical protein